MIATPIAFGPIVPELVLAIGGMVLLLWGAFARQDPARLVTIGALVLFVIVARLLFSTPDGSAFGGLIQNSAFTRFADLLVLLGSAASLLLAMEWNAQEGIARFEFPVLIVFATLGMLVMVGAGNLITLYLGLELQSMALYVCAAFARDNIRSSEAGLKYFVLGALASGLLLYGISLIYGFTGTTDYAGIAHALLGIAPNFGALIGVVFILVGLGFKVSAAPFHMWTPDVYEGAPTPVTALFGTAPKVAAMALLLAVFVGPFGHLLGQWRALVEIISIASMALGAFAAIAQTNIKRLLAYSSIGHMGYALIGLAASGSQGVEATLIYLAIYVPLSFAALGVVAGMRKQGRAVERIADLAGLGRSDPRLAFALAAVMLSMAGIPPLSGFFGKLYVFRAAVQVGLVPLAVIGVLTSVVAAFYYLRLLKVMYFDPAPGAAKFDARGGATSAVIAVGAAIAVLYVFLPGLLVTAAAAAAQSLTGAFPG